jgi:HEPN domain-containing protein
MSVMTYQSPFGDMDTDHEWPDALCLSRVNCANASEETLGEFYRGAIALIDAGIPQPAFFLARQLAELSLKAILGPEQVTGHDLEMLLKRLEEADDELFAAGDDQHLVVEFIRDLQRRDPKGDEGRYPTTTQGVPSLAAVCCANPPLFREYVNLLFSYTQDRISRAAQTV